MSYYFIIKRKRKQKKNHLDSKCARFSKQKLKQVHSRDRRLEMKSKQKSGTFPLFCNIKNCNIFYQRMGRGISVKKRNKANDPTLDAKIVYINYFRRFNPSTIVTIEV